MKYLADIITFSRIISALAILTVPVYSTAFYLLYLLAGLSDMIDGPVARITHHVTEFGSRLDTAADLIFVSICMIRLFPVIPLDKWVYGWCGLIILIKGRNMMIGYQYSGRFPAIHSRMNRLTGFLLFLFPVTVMIIDVSAGAFVLCAIASAAAVQEGYLIRNPIRKGKSL